MGEIRHQRLGRPGIISSMMRSPPASHVHQHFMMGSVTVSKTSGWAPKAAVTTERGDAKGRTELCGWRAIKASTIDPDAHISGCPGASSSGLEILKARVPSLRYLDYG